MKYMRIILTLGAISGLIALAAWKLGANKVKMNANAAIAEQKVTVFPVTVISPAMQTIAQNFEADGEFSPNRQLNFTAESAGRVVSLRIKKGDFVQKGQTIATLDNEQTKIDLSLAETNLEKAKADLNKYEIMLAANAVQKQQVEDAKIQLKNTENRIETLKRQLRMSSIVSPISGWINELSIEMGSYLAPGTPIAAIVDISSLKLDVNLLDVEVVKVKKAQRVKVSADLYPGVKINGTVSAISTIADGSRKFEVEITIPNNSSMPLKAGMTGTATFEFGGSKTALMMPTNCIVGSIQEPKVYVVNGEIAQLKPIKVGSIHGDEIEILEGLTAAEKVISAGQLNLSDGVNVRIVN